MELRFSRKSMTQMPPEHCHIGRTAIPLFSLRLGFCRVLRSIGVVFFVIMREFAIKDETSEGCSVS